MTFCLYHTSYSKCAKCKEKQVSNKLNNLWLLDSGASFHFTNNMDDFAEYSPLKKAVHIATATNTTEVIGVGTVILNYKSEVVHLALVYYIPKLNCRLISMGALLRDGMVAHRNAKHINILTQSNQVFLKFKPCQDGDTIYCIKSLPNNERIAYSMPHTSNYQIWHKRFAHPLRDVLKHAQKHTEGFSQVKFLHEESICHGCAQGKMPLQAFPKNPKRASRLFELIHSDLKSFPIESYHKHKYVITFIDNFISFAWTICLKSKDTAIFATKHFVTMVQVQFWTNVTK
jgi:hypothetical protein